MRHRPGSRWPRSAGLAFALAACGEAALTDPQLGERAALIADLDPARASARVRRLIETCDDLPPTLAALGRSRIEPRAVAGLVADAVQAARARCADPAGALGDAGGDLASLARAELTEDPALARRVLGGGAAHPAVRLRRASLAREAGDLADARVELAELVATTGDPHGRAELAELSLARPAEALIILGEAPLADPVRRPAAVAALAAAGRHAEAAAAVAAAPLAERPDLARRAVSATVDLAALLAGQVDVELLVAGATRVGRERGAVDVIPILRRASAAAPDRPELLDALASAAAAAGQLDEAIAAWRGAADLAPAVTAYRRAPVAALLAAGRRAEAGARVAAEAAAARRSGDPDRLVEAASIALAGGAPARAVELLDAAHALDPASGRIRFELAGALAAAGRRDRAVEIYAALLVCGAHGRAWHRHEVSARLVAAAAGGGADVARAALAAPGCVAVAPDDLAIYDAEIGRQLTATAR